MAEQSESHAETMIMMGHRLVYFAAERTLMAWVRASLGLMAVGFVIDRFGLVVREIAPQLHISAHTNAASFWAGSLLVVMGALMAVVATARYWHFGYYYRRGESTVPGHGILFGVIFAAIIAIFGFAIAVFLLSFGR